MLLADILSYVEDMIIGVHGFQTDMKVSTIGNLECKIENSLGWIAVYKQNKQELAETTSVRYIICDNTIVYNEKMFGKVLIKTNNPRLVFIKIADHFYKNKNNDNKNIGHTYIDESAIVHSKRIGHGCIIHPHVVIYENVIIGNNTIIQAGTIIGNDGLGCERDDKGGLCKFPHYGSVIIGNNVDIGPNCQIVRGTLSDTYIGDGTKIDGLCSIGHNSRIGENNWIASSVTIAGSVCIGNNNTIYAGSIIKDQIRVGNKNIIGMGSVLTKNVLNAEKWYGVPAKKIEL